MNRHVLLFACCIVASSLRVCAQTPSLWLMSADSSFRTGYAAMAFHGKAGLASNALDNWFFKKLTFGGHLDEDYINELAHSMRHVNRAGGDLEASMTFYSFSDSLLPKTPYRLMMQVSHTTLADLTFTRDLFQTVFQGNASFAGREAMLAPSGGQYQVFQKFGIGLFDSRNFSGFTLNYVNGQEFRSLKVDESDLFTSANGDSLHLSYQGEYWRSDTSQSGWGVGDGSGLALDFVLNTALGGGKKGYVSLSVENILSFVSWNRQFETYAFDSSLVYTGFEINDLFDLSADSISLPALEDTIEYTYFRKKENTGLPAMIHVRWMRQINENSFYETGIQVMPGRTAIPLLFAGYSFSPVRNMYVQINAHYGGFGGFNAGAGIQWFLRNQWYLQAGTSDLNALIMDSAKGMSAELTFARFFGKR